MVRIKNDSIQGFQNKNKFSRGASSQTEKKLKTGLG